MKCRNDMEVVSLKDGQLMNGNYGLHYILLRNPPPIPQTLHPHQTSDVYFGEITLRHSQNLFLVFPSPEKVPPISITLGNKVSRFRDQGERMSEIWLQNRV